MNYPLELIPIGTKNTKRATNKDITPAQKKKIAKAILRVREEIGFEVGDAVTVDVLNNLQS